MTWWLLTDTYNCVTTTIIKIWNICINPESSFLLLFCQFPPPSTAPGNHGLAVVVTFRTTHMWGYPAYGHFDYSFIYSPWCLWDLSALLHLSFLCLLLLVSISLHECTSVSIHSPLDEHLNCFQLSAILNRTCINMSVNVIFSGMICFNFSWLNIIHKHQIARITVGKHMFNFVRNCQSVF